jgi:hypothetical protein
MDSARLDGQAAPSLGRGSESKEIRARVVAIRAGKGFDPSPGEQCATECALGRHRPHAALACIHVSQNRIGVAA